MQTGRLFEIVYLLMERRRMTTEELARELEVSARTIRRDVEALSGAGIPVYMTRGKGGGVHLLDNYVLNKSLVSESEQEEILAALDAADEVKGIPTVIVANTVKGKGLSFAENVVGYHNGTLTEDTYRQAMEELA